MQNDIALIEFDQGVQFNEYVRPACVSESNRQLAEGTGVVISGWGTTQSGGSQPNILQEAEVNAKSIKIHLNCKVCDITDEWESSFFLSRFKTFVYKLKTYRWSYNRTLSLFLGQHCQQQKL